MGFSLRQLADTINPFDDQPAPKKAQPARLPQKTQPSLAGRIGGAIAGIGAAPHPVQTMTPQVSQALARPNFVQRGLQTPQQRQQFTQSLQQPKQGVVQGYKNLVGAELNATNKELVQPFISRPAAEVVSTVRDKLNGNKYGATYHPNSRLEKTVFGDTPVQSIQQKALDQYKRQSTSNNMALRLASKPLAVAEAGLSVANDIPVVGMAGKATTKLVEKVAPKAIPTTKLVGQAIGAQKKAADLRMTAVQASNNEKQLLQRQLQASQKQMNGLPIDPQSARATNVLMGKQDSLQARLAQNRALHSGIQNPIQKVTDRLLTAQPGLSMKAVHDSNLHPDQNQFIEDYAAILKQTGEGNGVTIHPDGRRISNNVRDATDKGKRLTNADYFDKARREIESGKAPYGLSDHYKELSASLPGQPLEVPQGFENIRKPTAPVKSTTQPPVLPDTAKTKLKASAKQQPVVQNESPLPEYGTKRVSGIDKAFRSTRSIIERQGDEGRELAGKLQGSRDTQELYLAELQKAMPTVTKLAKGKAIGKGSLDNKDFENFVEATQGKAEARTPQIAQAVKEWQAAHPGIRQRAVDAGLDVGDLGQTYYPHFVDYDAIFKDKNKYNVSINHLVETGQAKTPEEAIKLLNHVKDVSRNRQFGNLEAARLVDLPFYDKTPNSLTSYLQGSTKRIANTETFGAKDEKALELIAKAGQKGYDTEAMKDAFNVAVGAKQYNPTASKVSGNVRKYITTTRLGLGALTNTSQNVNTGIVTGHLRTLGAAVKQLDKKTRDYVADTGVISDALLNDLKTQVGYESFGQKLTGKVINKTTAPFFGSVEKFNRSVAATAGKDYALRLAQKGDEATLRKLGVTGKIENKTLTKSQMVQASRKIVEKTQFKVDPQDLPGWVDSPGGKMVAQFRTFSYNQGKFFSNEILKPAAKGNLLPAARLLAALPLGYGLYEARRVIDGRPEEEDKKKVATESFSKIGGAGLALDIYRSLNPTNSKYIPSDRRVTMALGAVGGPAAGVASQGIGALSELIQRKKTPEDQSRLDGKIALGKGENYTDATPAARFGLSQIPIVGTPIKNRLLPYQKTAEAEAGTKSGGQLSSADQVKVSMNSPEAKKFLSLSAADQKALAATDPNARALYDQKKAIEAATGTPALRSPGLSEGSTKLLNQYDHLTTAAKNKRLDDPTKRYAYKQAELENDKLSGKLSDDDVYTKEKSLLKDKLLADNGVKTKQDETKYLESPKGKFELAVAQYDMDSKAGKISSLDKYKKEEELGKLEVESKYSKDAVDIYGMSKTRIQEYFDKGKITTDLANELISLDNDSVKAGLQKYGKLSGGNGKVAVRGGSGGRASLAAHMKLYGNTSKSAFDYEKSLRSLVQNARLSKSRA